VDTSGDCVRPSALSAHHRKAAGQGFPQDATSCGAHSRHVTQIPITLLSLGAGVLVG